MSHPIYEQADGSHVEPLELAVAPRRETAFRAMLDSLVRLIEHQSPRMRCSILLLDADGKTLRHGAAPSLPKHYCDAIDGLVIGDGVGSCGTAAFTRQLTIVADISTHAYWAPFKDLALPCALRACWSTPILSTTGTCLGTFAMYYDEVREPSSSDLLVIGTSASLAASIIERESLLASTEAQRQELSQANRFLEEQHAELEAANEQLQDNTVELELLNEQLQESAAELEAQAEELEASNQELESAIEELRHREEELAEANKTKAQFLATMSHELRTPLNAIAGYADLLLSGVRGEMSAEQQRDVERMKRSGQHLLGLINDILNFAKLEAGRVEFHVEDVNVGPLVGGLEELIRPQVDAKTLQFSRSVGSEKLVARADAEKLRQVLLNLVTNAVKFTPEGGQVCIDCQDAEDGVSISVKDTGPGIPEAQLARIFDPFVQVNRDAIPTSQRGVGLGLAISRDLALGMGGALTVSSTEGVGSVFTLRLPKVASRDQAVPLHTDLTASSTETTRSFEVSSVAGAS
jgi:signal transduction histidine kinase